jgi:hypothetical protein
VKRIALALAALAAAAALLPGAAFADDAGLAGTVAAWSLKVTGPAQALQKIDASTTTKQALRASNRLASVAGKGAAAIALESPSSKNGRQLKALAGRAFADFAQAGRLLASAIRDVQAGRTGATVTAKVNRAVRLATEGSTLLRRASTIIPKLL